MKKQTVIITMFTMVCFLLLAWLPVQAEDLQGCYHKSKGNLRILTDPAKGCKKSELPVTLSGAMDGTADVNPVPAFEGEVCWLATAQSTDPLTPFAGVSFIANGVVKYIGNGMYRIEAGMIDNSILGILYPYVIHGTAVYLNGKILIHFGGTDDYTPSALREVGMGQAMLETDLNGTFWIISKFYNPAGVMQDPSFPAGFTDLYYSGTFTTISCSQ